MTVQPPAPGEPYRPHGPRNSGDAWVKAPTGERYWGRFGAAGLLALDPERRVLLQHRAGWSHFGDTWGLPGGARHEGEPARDAALREAAEEAGVPDRAVRPRFLSVLDLGYWSYTTLVGDVISPFEPRITDPESRELAWVPISQVTTRPLHPGFAAAWPRLSAMLSTRPVVVVDAANVVGAVPDGWWKDRRGAAERLLARIAELAFRGIPGIALGLPEDVWFPEWVVVVEGQARAAGAPPGIDVVRAPGPGDDTIAAQVDRLVAMRREVIAVTSDRELARRIDRLGGAVHGARWLTGLPVSAQPVRPHTS